MIVLSSNADPILVEFQNIVEQAFSSEDVFNTNLNEIRSRIPYKMMTHIMEN